MPNSHPPRVYTHPVRKVVTGSPGSLRDGTLTVDIRALEEIVCDDEKIAGCEVTLVQPGQSTRMVHVLDSLRPVCSVEGPGRGAFPGLVSDSTSIDLHDAVELGNVLVTAIGHVPAVDSFLTQQEGILDMAGPGAELSPLADRAHVALAMVAVEGTSSADTSNSFRKAAARVAEHLAALALVDGAGSPEPLPETPSTSASRIVHICEVSAFGEMFTTLVAGRSVIGMLPVVVSASAMRAGAVVSADYHYAGQRNYTCYYQRNPVAEAVSTLTSEAMLAGTILLPVGLDNRAKSHGAAYSAHLAAAMGADGAVITAVAGGNAHLDVMFAVRECEKRGIRSALSLVEMAGPDGADPGMVDTVPEADLIVSTGNREELIALPAIADVIGGRVLLDGPPEEGGGADSDGDLLVPLRTIVGANNEMGAWKVGALLS